MEAEVNHHPVFFGPTSHAFRRPALYALPKRTPQSGHKKSFLTRIRSWLTCRGHFGSRPSSIIPQTFVRSVRVALLTFNR